MYTPRDMSSRSFERFKSAFARMASEIPDLKEGASNRQVEAWFLGPKAENLELLKELILSALDDQAEWRRSYKPADPSHISNGIRQSQSYLDAVAVLRTEFKELLRYLKLSVPFFSMRYQGHMIWELTLPSIAGYFAAMLFNPNNVAFEASTATTIMELRAGNDLCRMMGYELPTEEAVREKGAIQPWGHITCDGTVANIEALWAARNLKFYALSMREALRAPELGRIADKLLIEHRHHGPVKLAAMSAWDAINLPADEVLKLPERLESEFKIGRDEVTAALEPYSVQTLGLAQFARQFEIAIGESAIIVPGTKHYSFPKAAALLGLGGANLIDVPVDVDGRLDLDELDMRLEDCLAAQRPVLAVVAVIGTTEESAVDPLADIVELRGKYAQRGLYFLVHADAAWGGYHRSLINERFDIEPLDLAKSTAFALGEQPPIQVKLSSRVIRHMEALRHADTITVDPHKSGYIPYPAGALCYRNSAMRDLVTFKAPVVFHGEDEPNVGLWGIEGSKPGAAAAAVYMSHRVIRPTRDGYGAIIGRALYSCRKLYARLLFMATAEDPFIVVPLPRLPSEQDGKSEQEISQERALVASLIDKRESTAIAAEVDAMKLLDEIGPDQNILAYAFNFKNKDGALNPELRLANQLNNAIYEFLSIDPGDPIHGYDLIVSTTDIDEKAYGKAFVDHYKKRLGVAGSPGSSITVLRSVVMDPWMTETSQGSFIDVIEAELQKAVRRGLEALKERAEAGSG